MPSSIDSSILKALSISPSTATIKSHGGSGFASTSRITTPTTSYFVKTSSSPGSDIMFQGEHASLNAIHNAVPSLCPKSFAWGKLSDSNGYFLATEFLELGGGSRNRGGGTGMSLAEKLGKLHSTPAPMPEEYDKPVFGFPVTTCCGDTPQKNDFKSSWAEFFGQCRLMAILERCEKQQGKDAALRTVIESTVKEVVPRLLGDGHLGGEEGVMPVVCHGDLWSGNKGKGSFVGREGLKNDEPGPVEDVVYDPSAYYGHSESELGIMSMFGGFGSSFMKAYHEVVPKTKPVDEYVDRVKLYESYHHLNHHAIFGGGYKGGAVSILKGLLKKYGDN